MNTIVWDVDDVLNNLTELWLREWRESHPEVRLEYGDLASNPPHELLGLSFENYLASLDQIRASVAAQERLTPRPEIVQWMGEHGHHHRHMALTARPGHTAGAAAAWVMNHFGAWIRTVAFVPVRKPAAWPDYDLRKVDYLRSNQINGMLIDDSLANVTEMKREGLPALLFPQPWNGAKQTVPQLLAELSSPST